MINVRTLMATHAPKSVLLLISLLVAACTTHESASLEPIRISVIGTNDVHGALVLEKERGGLVTLSGYIDAVRAARAEDGGAVLLIDAGDRWQGTVASNLNEGAAVVEAYNAMGYTAAAIGNHEFDFGPIGDAATPMNAGDDPRGALKQRATEMEFPLLAANLVDQSTGNLVAWNNVSPAVLVDVQGITVGIIGATTERTKATTIASNFVGLETESLLVAITREARQLRSQGAQLVIVTAHAGSRCEDFTDPYDLSSCDMDGEIMRLANALPVGLVDHIIAGHKHERIAHIVNDISITSNLSQTRTFSRTDFLISRQTGDILSRQVYAPQTPCPFTSNSNDECAWKDGDQVSVAHYEGRPVSPNLRVLEISRKAADIARDKSDEELGPYLETAFLLLGNPESPLSNLFTTAILDSVDGDVAIHNVTGGIRATLPEGPLTYASVFEMFPFDNRVIVLDLSGAELRRIIGQQAHNHRQRAGFAGMRVLVDCNDDAMSIRMLRQDGSDILDNDRVAVIVNDFLVLGGDDILTPAMPEDGFVFGGRGPLTRDVLVDWFRMQPGRMNAADFQSTDNPRWTLPEELPASCTLPTSNP